jgi:hypothetical protein
VDKINSTVIQDFLQKISIANRTKQRTIVISPEEGNELALQIGFLMAKALENAPTSTTNASEVITLNADGGSF